jgi:hypothetical protein
MDKNLDKSWGQDDDVETAGVCDACPGLTAAEIAAMAES